MTTSASPPQSGYKIPPDALAEFMSNRWTSSLLRSPDYTAVETTSRRTKRKSGEDAFFADTLGTSATIPHLLTLRKNNPIDPPRIAPSIPAPPGRPAVPKSKPELVALLKLGTPGISGHPSTAHGGVLATVLDEIMSLAVGVQIPGYDGNIAKERGRIYTMQLDARFHNPVYVPAVAVVKAWVLARDGRKFWMMGQVLQEAGLFEDGGEGNGASIEAVRKKVVCAEAVGFWIQTKESL